MNDWVDGVTITGYGEVKEFGRIVQHFMNGDQTHCGRSAWVFVQRDRAPRYPEYCSKCLIAIRDHDDNAGFVDQDDYDHMDELELIYEAELRI